jgi:homoserine kinase
MEGHPDNAAASLFGGLNLVTTVSGKPIARQVPVAELKLIVALPRVSISTRQMRRALPRRVSLGDAVFNVGRALLTVEALRAGDYELLEIAMVDRLHQRHRLRFIPAGEAAMTAARKAGAAAVALSGAGPSLVAFAADRHERIAKAMARTFKGAGLEVRTFILDIETEGARVLQPKEGASSR